VDSLLPQLETYLGNTGSDMQERKRLTHLLENLRTHGMVSEVDAQDCITIRPMIVHLLNPENLQTLLLRLREVNHTGQRSQRRGHTMSADASFILQELHLYNWGAFAGRHQVAIDGATAPSSAPRAAARPRWSMR
jgi:hypothetical protein